MNWNYLAGFIDGEGTIILRPPRVRLYISNTNRLVLIKIQRFVKCGKVYDVKRKIKNNWKKQYCWTVGNHKDCLRILRKLRYKLIIKDEKCADAIKYIENKRWFREYISKDELLELKELPYREIAKKIGVSHYCVFKYQKKYGLR